MVGFPELFFCSGNIFYQAASPLSLSTCQTLNGVIGMPLFSPPGSDKASITALEIAGGSPTVGASTPPLRPRRREGEEFQV